MIEFDIIVNKKDWNTFKHEAVHPSPPLTAVV